MTLAAILPWVLSIVSIFMLYMMGNKSKWGPRIGVAAQVLWIIFVVSTEQWGLLPGVLGWTLVQVRNLVKWEGWHLYVRGYDAYGKKEPLTETICTLFYDWRNAESLCIHQVFIPIKSHHDSQVGQSYTCLCQLCGEEFHLIEEQEHIVKIDEDTWMRGKKDDNWLLDTIEKQHGKAAREAYERTANPMAVKNFMAAYGIDLPHHDNYDYEADSPYNTGGTEQDQ